MTTPLDPITCLHVSGQICLIDKTLENFAGYAAQKLLHLYQESGAGEVEVISNVLTIRLLGITAGSKEGVNAALRAWQHAARDRLAAS